MNNTPEAQRRYQLRLLFYTHIDDHHEDTIMYGVWIAQRKSGKWRWVWKTEGVDNMKHATATVLARMIGTMKARAKLDGICGNAELEAKGRALIAEAREAMADDAIDDAIDEEVTV